MTPARASIMNNTPYTPTTIDYSFLNNRVKNILNPKSGGYTSEETKVSTLAFWNAFNSAYTGDKTIDSTGERSGELEKFLYDLRTKGAAKFLADLNQEKIDKMVEEYRQKLIAEMGDSVEAMQIIEKLVEEFKKQLIEEMKDRMEDEMKRKGKNAMPLSSDTAIQEILDIQQKKSDKPLEELLK